MDPVKLAALGLDADHTERDDTVIRRGAHLRWQLAPALDYPVGGFEIWRRRYRSLDQQARTCWSTVDPLPGGLARASSDSFVFGRLVPSGERGVIVDGGRELDLTLLGQAAWRVEIRYSVLSGGSIDANVRAYSGAILDRARREVPDAGWFCKLLDRLDPPCEHCCDCLDPKRLRDPKQAKAGLARFSSLSIRNAAETGKGKGSGCNCRCGGPPEEETVFRRRERELRDLERKRRARSLSVRSEPLPEHLRAGLDRVAGAPTAKEAAPALEHTAPPPPKLEPPAVGTPLREPRDSEVVLSEAGSSGRLNPLTIAALLWCWVRLALYGFIYTLLCYLCRYLPGRPRVYTGTLTLEGSEIRELEIRGQRLCIHEVCYYTHECTDKEPWQRVATVDWPADAAEVDARLGAEALPSYLADEWDAAQRQALVQQLAELRAAAPGMWSHERTDAEDAGEPKLTWHPWRMLQATAVAPYFARLIGLGWVDATAAPGQRYDYRVVSAEDAAVKGEYANVRLEPYRPLAPVTGITAAQVDVAGVGATDRVGLGWDDPDPLTPELDLPVGHHVYAGGYGFHRPPNDPATAALAWVTANRPVLRDADAPEDRPRFVDPGTYPGWAAWQVAALGLFGRHGTITDTHWANLAEISAPPPPDAVTARVLLPEDPDLTAAQLADALPLPGALELTWQWDDRAYNPRAHESVTYFPLLHQGGFHDLEADALSLLEVGDRGRVATTAALGAAARGAWRTLLVDGKQWRVVETQADRVWILPELDRPLPGDDEPRRVYPNLSPPQPVKLLRDGRYAPWWDRHLTAHRVPQQERRSGALNQVASDGDSRTVETDLDAAFYTGNTHLGTVVVDDGGEALRYRVDAREPDVGGHLALRLRPLDAAARAYAFTADQPCTWYPGYRLVVPLDAADLPFPLADLDTDGMATCACSIVAETTSSVVPGSNVGPAGQPAPGVWRKFQRPEAPAVTDIPLSWASRPDYHGTSEFTVTWTPRAHESYLVYRATDAALVEADLASRFRQALEDARDAGSLDAAALRGWLADGARDGLAGIDDLRDQATRFATGDPPGGDLAGWLLTQARKGSAAVAGHGTLRTLLEDARTAQHAVLESDRAAALLGLAGRDDLNTAWNLVTARPVNGGSFTDRFQGRASNWYFYRLRSVDRAQNRSPTLSDPVGPVALLDTTPPRAPTLVWHGGDRGVDFEWRDTEPGIARYRIFRTEDPRRAEDWRLMGEPVVDVDGRARSAADRVPQGKVFYYKLVSTRRIDYEKDSTPRELFIDSQDDRFVEATTFSRTPPPPPAWQGQRLVLGGVELTVRFGEEHAKYMVQRRAAGARTWGSLTAWTPVPDADLVFQDEPPRRGRYLYRVQVKNRAGVPNETDNVHVYIHE